MDEAILNSMSLGELADLRRSLDGLIYSRVQSEREHGRTWAEIGRTLRVSTQEAHRRYRRPFYGFNEDPAAREAWRRDVEPPA